MLQMGVDAFAHGKGVPLDTKSYNTALVRRYLLAHDRDEIVQDIVSALHTRVSQVLPKTTIEHRFAYRILPNYDLLIGLDPRDFEHDPDPLQDYSIGDDPLDLL